MEFLNDSQCFPSLTNILCTEKEQDNMDINSDYSTVDSSESHNQDHSEKEAKGKIEYFLNSDVIEKNNNPKAKGKGAKKGSSPSNYVGQTISLLVWNLKYTKSKHGYYPVDGMELINHQEFYRSETFINNFETYIKKNLKGKVKGNSKGNRKPKISTNADIERVFHYSDFDDSEVIIKNFLRCYLKQFFMEDNFNYCLSKQGISISQRQIIMSKFLINNRVAIRNRFLYLDEPRFIYL